MKLLKRTKGWGDINGITYPTKEAAIGSSVRSKFNNLVDYMRDIPLESMAQFTAIWLNENKPLLRTLKGLLPQEPPADYPNYLATRIKRGAVYEGYKQWQNRSEREMNTTRLTKAPTSEKVNALPIPEQEAFTVQEASHLEVFIPHPLFNRWSRATQNTQQSFWQWSKLLYTRFSGEDDIHYYERLMKGLGVVLPNEKRIQGVGYVTIDGTSSGYSDYLAAKNNTTKFTDAMTANGLPKVANDGTPTKEVLGNSEKSLGKYPA